jgi:hypothetical protein
MAAWTDDELTKVGRAEEIQVASLRPDGSLRNPVTVWAVRHGDDIYVRSVRGKDGAWFRGVQQTKEGRIRVGGVEKDVSFAEAGHDVEGEIDGAYRTKYRRYAGRILNSILTPEARSTTIKLVPRSTLP